MRRMVWLFTVVLAVMPAVVNRATAGEVKWNLKFADNAELPPMFKQMEFARRDQSKVVAFLGHFKEPVDRKKPLLIFFDGSGAQSHFVRVGDKLGYSLAGIIASAAAADYHVVAIEKRGVPFAAKTDRPGSAEGASEEYNEHATLEGRSGDALLVLDALLKEPTIDASRVLVVGHSEGADVAAAVAAADSRVTHCAFLAGGGATQFYDLMALQRRELRKQNAPAVRIEHEMSQMEAQFREIMANSVSTKQFFMGHAYKRWASYVRTSPVETLKKSTCKLYIANGSEDQSVPIESFDVLAAELIAAGRKDVVVRRFPGRDHSLRERDSDPKQPTMKDVFDEIRGWAEGKPVPAE